MSSSALLLLVIVTVDGSEMMIILFNLRRLKLARIVWVHVVKVG